MKPPPISVLRRFAGFLLFLALCSTLRAQTLYAPSAVPSNVLSDAISLLQAGTHTPWKLDNGTPGPKGIVLRLDQDRSFTTKESYRIQSDGRSLLTITSASAEGLVFGLYKHLRSLGYRFYLPDELYTIVPSLSDPFGEKMDVVGKPFLQVRNFAGTGGFGSGRTDPDRSVERDWNLWKLRNGFGSAYQLAGHRGEEFILANKAELQKHPDWMAAPFAGNSYDVTTKINYLNKDAVAFYVNWSLQPFRKQGYQAPPPAFSDFLSMEPSDGGGYLNDQPGFSSRKLPSVSDQVYGAANEAAKQLDRLFPNNPNIGVNLYAYSGHAEPPSFPLHPRVFVQLIPYQFQNVAYGPSFIKMWAEKARRFGIYDYLKYADAQYDVPGGITLEESMKRLVHGAKSGSEGITYETSYSKFSTGIMLWVLGRYLTDGDANWQKNLDSLTSALYEEAAPPVKELFTLFYGNPSFNVNDMGTAVRLVDRASTLARKQTVRDRITELKEYLQYTSLVYASRDLSKGNLRDRLLPLTRYAWKVYESKIIHSYRIMQLVGYSFLNSEKTDPNYNLYQQLFTAWFPESERSAADWSRTPQGLDRQQVDQDFVALRKTYASVTGTAHYTMDGLRTALREFEAIPSFVIAGDPTTRGYFGVYAERPLDVRIRYTASGPTPKLVLSAIDNNYSRPLAFTIDKAAGELRFEVPAGETTVFINATNGTTYRMQVQSEGMFFFDGAPRGLMAFYKNFSDPPANYTYDPDFYPSYVFIPQTAASLQYKVQVNALALTPPSGHTVPSEVLQREHGGYELRQLSIAPVDRGHFWKAVVSGNYNYSLLNVTDRYFLIRKK